MKRCVACATLLLLLVCSIGCGAVTSGPATATAGIAALTPTPVPPTNSPLPHTETPTATSTGIPALTPTPTPTETPTTTLEPTPAPTRTLSPTPTIPPSPTPLANGLPILEPITVGNAGRVQLLTTLKIPNYMVDQAYHGQCGVAFSPDGSLLIATCEKNSLPIWELPSLELRHRLFDVSEHTVSCDFSPDGKMVACGKYENGWTIPAWNPETGEYLMDIGNHMSPVWDLDFSPDGQLLASCSLFRRGDVRLWRVSPPERLWIHELNYEECISVSFHPSGQVVAASSIHGQLEILDAESGEMMLMLVDATRHIGDLTYSPSGDLLAAGCDDDNIYIWDTTDYHLVSRLIGHQSYVNGVVFSADETYLVSGSDDGTIAIWALDELRMLNQLSGHEDTVLRVDLNPDNTLIASVSWDGTVRLWGVVAGQQSGGWTRPADGMIMVYVPGGEFQMGSTQAEIEAAFELCERYRGIGKCRRQLFADEAPAHRVTLESFWIDRTEVTNSQYDLCVEAGGCRPADCENEFPIDGPVKPAGCVTWADAQAYCKWADARLPTEAEWEYAARGPEGTVFPWGDAFDPSRLNYCDINCTYEWHDMSYDDGYSWPAPVGSYETGVSWCGAQDMAGNAWEWVADWYDAAYYSHSPASNPQGPDSGSDRVIRGGSAHFFPPYQRSANRAGISMQAIYASGGFRCAVGATSPAPAGALAQGPEEKEE